MKKYRVIANRLNVRKAPNSAAATLGNLPRGSEFIGTEESHTVSGQVWAQRSTGGWRCVYDRSTRYCEEVPMPAPSPELPPMPEPPGGLDVVGRLTALEGWARGLGFKG